MKHFLTMAVFIAMMVVVVARAEDEGAASPAPASTSNDGGGEFVTEKRGNETIKYKKKTTYDFDGANIDGAYNKPSGSYISNIKDVKAKSIIKIRENFDAEVLDSARHLK